MAKKAGTRTVTENKEARFIRVAEKFTNKALDSIADVKRLARTDIYSYTPKQVTTIVAALKEAVEDVETALMNPNKDRFSLSVNAKPLNPMCNNCETRKNGECNGTTETVWTGCVYKSYETES